MFGKLELGVIHHALTRCRTQYESGDWRADDPDRVVEWLRAIEDHVLAELMLRHSNNEEATDIQRFLTIAQSEARAKGPSGKTRR
jgi:hypothetical protein